MGIETGVFPLVIFMGVGAMTDFGPLLANPKTLLLGAAAQFGIFATLLGALGLSSLWILISIWRRPQRSALLAGQMAQALFMWPDNLRPIYWEP